MPNKVTIALIESSYLIRSGIENILKEIQLVQLSEIFDGTEKNLLRKIEFLKPDFLIINPNCISGSLNQFILSLQQEITVIGLVSDKSAEHIRSRFSCCLHLNDDKHGLLSILNKVVGSKSNNKKAIKNEPLTDRETTILKFVTLGLTNQEIAEKLFLSIHTVMTHRKKITRKLGIKTVSGLTVYAILNKIIEIQDVEQ